MPHRRPESLSPPSLAIPYSPGCPSAGACTTLKGFFAARRPSIAESLSAGALTTSFDRFAPPQSRTIGKIWPGTFIVFALSTEELAQEYPGDSEIHHRICEYNPGRYLGLVTSSFVQSIEDDGSTVEDVIVHFVSRDTPQPSVIASHFIPIFPVSNTIPTETSALHTSILFPWIDCKQWTTCGVRLRVCRKNASALVFELCPDDFERFEDKAGKDYSGLEYLDATLDDEEKDTLASLLVAPFALPAEIWLDIRNHADIKEPPSFFGDVESLER
ncbi:uncharacterized protein EDB91DRAFT_1253995 [Suillus paluster]|uniref:uncharacterized protein n=1 Tax=Suillus paluster TaxID=48578 RepID=UPI001B879333|nr:uncharacterized protein EDB91DRAFT_1253995 [Suillus paluster]KAG1727165.1 hypothetical protein EDB91DRAFT_1253995 [Suillus paluster]